MQNTLLLGFGNADRQDDGVAWHILVRLANLLGRSAPDELGEGFEFEGEPIEFLFALQLTPELAETAAAFERVCFIDAHTGNLPNDLQIVPLQANFQNSPFTHHMTPETLLAFIQALYHIQPQAILVSVRGYEFGFERELSPQTSALADQAVTVISQWLQ